MSRLKQTRVFISYARKDAAGLAQRLLQDLSAEGLVVWLDTENIGGGDSWTMAIEEANFVSFFIQSGLHKRERCRREAVPGSAGALSLVRCQAGQIKIVFL